MKDFLKRFIQHLSTEEVILYTAITTGFVLSYILMLIQ